MQAASIQYENADKTKGSGFAYLLCQLHSCFHAKIHVSIVPLRPTTQQIKIRHAIKVILDGADVVSVVQIVNDIGILCKFRVDDVTGLKFFGNYRAAGE